MILLWSDGNNSLPVRYSNLSILPDDNAYTFAASLLISCCNFSFLIKSLIAMVIFVFFLKDYLLKCKWLSDAKVVVVVSITKNSILSQYICCKDS